MAIKSLLAKPLAAFICKKIERDKQEAIADQERIFHELIAKASHTQFGRNHLFHELKNSVDFQTQVPIRDYEQFKNYIQEIKEGKQDILWPGKPCYLAKTSGTTSGVKYIPISKDSISNHINTARNALLSYMKESGNYQFADGNMIFLSGSPELEQVAGIPTGRLSGIVNHHVPAYLRSNQLPTYTTNCIEDWEEKLEHIVQETINKNMSLISGIPPWMQMYFDRLTERSGKRIRELFPNFSVLAHGGVNFEPYKKRLFDAIGAPVDCIETFPASEGFFAFQDSQHHEGLLLNTNSGIFFEFVPSEEIFHESPTRLTLKEVSLHKNYALIISSNAGLWAYNIGDTIKFVSLNPYRIIVTGRIKHFISAFGEHVIAEEVEHALLSVAHNQGIGITEFTVAPMIAQEEGKSYHEWFIEFEQEPSSLQTFAHEVDDALRQKNIYYDDLIRGQILQPLKIQPLKKNAFIDYMKGIGKLGGQNKVPRLSNDRTLAENLTPFIDQ